MVSQRVASLVAIHFLNSDDTKKHDCLPQMFWKEWYIKQNVVRADVFGCYVIYPILLTLYILWKPLPDIPIFWKLENQKV